MLSSPHLSLTWQSSVHPAFWARNLCGNTHLLVVNWRPGCEMRHILPSALLLHDSGVRVGGGERTSSPPYCPCSPGLPRGEYLRCHQQVRELKSGKDFRAAQWETTRGGRWILACPSRPSGMDTCRRISPDLLLSLCAV